MIYVSQPHSYYDQYIITPHSIMLQEYNSNNANDILLETANIKNVTHLGHNFLRLLFRLVRNLLTYY